MRATRWPADSSASLARLHAPAQASSMPSAVVSATPIRRPFGTARGGGVGALAITENSCLTSATLRPSGEITDRPAGSTLALGTRSGEGRKPTTPQQDAGMRIEPPMSVPMATVAIPAATAAALPPLDPPGVMPARHGLLVAGKIALVVPTAAASSGRLVLPRMAAPAARARGTAAVASSGTRSRHTGLPSVHGIPLTGRLSLTASVTPARGPFEDSAFRSTYTYA